ncbi:hypothetical protein HAX54_021292 [Datura stramonium]|uniref:Uncharacterized protein n=1 Tax=Datura stramonium TaxID=4076 RepID=A0ABS8UUU3_DATST|nr:hypothetical protein [Datura stramonium]
MGRSPCCDESGLKKGPWTPEEDQKLTNYINKHGHGSWRALPKLAGLNRCGKSCRLRWSNYLRPDIKRGKFSQEEEQTILNFHAVLGNKWSTIATHLPGRTDNEIKNYWNTHLKKRLIQMGYDPMTHRPRTDIFNSLQHLIALANLKELMEHNHSWQEQAMRLHYLQNLLQQPHNNNLSTLSAIQNVEAYKLLSSLKDSQFLGTNNHLGNNTVPIQDSIPFSHLPELHTPCSFQTSLNKDKVGPQDSEFMVLSNGEVCSFQTSLNKDKVQPQDTEFKVMSHGEVCSFQTPLNKDKVRPQDIGFTVLSHGEVCNFQTPLNKDKVGPQDTMFKIMSHGEVCSYQTPLNKDKVQPQDTEFTILSHGEASPTSPWLPSLSPSPPLVINDQRSKENSSEVVISSCLPNESWKLPDYPFRPDSEQSLNKIEEAPPFMWSDLLEDSFFQDIDKF